MDDSRLQYPFLKDVLSLSNKELSSMSGSTVLITGGYGMLLSYTTLSICLYNSLNFDNRINLIIIVRDRKKALSKLSEFKGFEHTRIIESDLGNKLTIDGPLDYIIHGAGYGSPNDYLNKTDLVFKANIIGTYNLMNLAKEKNVKSFLNISSGSVYGDNLTSEYVDEAFLGQVDYNQARSFYSETKRFSEMITNVHSFSGSVLTLRPAHIYGPTMDIKNDSRIICSFIRDIVNNKPLTINSDGKDKRSFCHVADFTNGLLKVLINGVSGEKYNIGNDDMYMSINELAKIIAKSFPGLKISRQEDIIVRNEANKMLMISNKLNSIGWKPKIDITDGFVSTFNYYNSSL